MGFALSDLQLTSPAFTHNSPIPSKYTGEGEDISPPLAWSSLPDAADSLAVVCHDPDAPLVSPGGTYGFVHWVLYNIPATLDGLPENCSDHTAGQNDFGKTGYGGPMPPDGHGNHQYYFWLLAMQGQPELKSVLTLWELLQQAEPNIIGMNRLIGGYERR